MPGSYHQYVDGVLNYKEEYNNTNVYNWLKNEKYPDFPVTIQCKKFTDG